MLYIEPNSVIRVLKDVHLKPNYVNTLKFATITDQTNYFISKTKGYSSQNPNSGYTLTAQNYSRHDRAWLRVEIPEENLLDCDYIMFKNTSYGNKWFYAFITEVSYINNNVSDVHYLIDVMQTWAFDYDLNHQYFIEREHTETDEIGDNIIAEPVNGGIYVTTEGFKTGLFNDWAIVLFSTRDLGAGALTAFMPAYGCFLGGVYQGLDLRVYTPDNAGLYALQWALNFIPATGGPEAIANITMYPLNFLPPGVDFNNNSITFTSYDYRSSFFSRVSALEAIKRVKFNSAGDPRYENIAIKVDSQVVFDGYVPKNKKLYTYPYNYFVCTNQEGDMQEFKYEFFDPVVGQMFGFIPDYGINPSIMCSPYGYKEKYTPEQLTLYRDNINEITARPNLMYAMYVRNFPRSGWATSDLLPKIVQMGMSAAMSAASGVPVDYKIPGYSGGETKVGYGNKIEESLMATPTYSGFAYDPTGKYVKQLPGSVSHKGQEAVEGQITVGSNPEIQSILKSLQNSMATKPDIYSKIGEPNSMFTVGGIDFIFRQVFLDKHYAESVDNFFTKYGYQVNRLKVPAIYTSPRPHWNYIKTSDFVVYGSIPSDHADKIAEIYNNGITFWSNASEIGNYTLDNQPSVARPTITQQPVSVIIDMSTATSPVTASFTIAAYSPSGNTLNYQWQVCEIEGAWNDIPEANGTSVTEVITNVNDGYLYRCKVSNSNGYVYSDTAKIILENFAPVIRKQPTNITVVDDSTAYFTVQVDGTTPITYQWQYRTSAIGAWTNVTDQMGAGITTNKLNVPASFDMNGYEFRCVVTNNYGSATSTGATLTVTSAPVITAQPTDQTVAVGENAVFTVTVTGSTPLTYQWWWKSGDQPWYKNTTGGHNTNTLTVSGEARRNGYKYKCEITNEFGTVTSDIVTLTVT